MSGKREVEEEVGPPNTGSCPALCRSRQGGCGRRLLLVHFTRRALGMVVVAICGSVTLASCASPNSSPSMAIAVRPDSSLFDQPISIVISRLPARALVTVTCTSTDGKGVRWRSVARFRSTVGGVVDLATAPSLGGSYRGVEPMGIVSSMAPVGGGAGVYFWAEQGNTFQLGVRVGTGATASASSTRRALAPGVAARTETLANEGFIGQLWAPASGHFRQPAILEFGGSEGGLDGQLVGAALADAGYPTLDIAYFGEPGLPRTLSDIPLEYFARALRWLRSQPGVDGSKVFVLSGSRGSEAALLLGVHYPALVSGVIASSPSDVAICAYPGCTGPAWTLNGRPLPYTKEFDTPEPTDNPAAVIPVQEIRGPVFLDCGGADKVWTSCPYARAIMARLASHNFPYPHVLYAYPRAGHFIDFLVPYEPLKLAAASADVLGAGPQSNQIARASLWPHILSFLASSSSGS